MTQKSKIILLFALGAIILAFAIFAAYFRGSPSTTDEQSGLRDFFTFGRSETRTPSLLPAQSLENISQTNPGLVSPSQSNLIQLTTKPVAGATALYVERSKPITAAPANPTTAPVLEWTRDLKEGDAGQDVKELQQFLNLNLQPKDAQTTASTQIAKLGAGSPGAETIYFGKATKTALIVFQEKFASDILAPQQLEKGTGVADARTRQKIHELKALVPEKEMALAVRYIDQASGTVHQTFIDTIADKRVTENTIPRVHEAFFANSGTAAILRYVKGDNRTIETFSGIVPKIMEGGDTILEMRGSFLPENISALAVSPDNTKIFYLTPLGTSAVGTIANTDGSGKTQLFSSAFTEWTPQWATNRTILLTTKPSSNVPGYAYILDTSTREFSKVLGNVLGLTTLMSPDGKKILYSKTAGNGGSFTLALYDMDAKRTSDLGVDTLPEKCAWAADSITLYCAIPDAISRGAYPDIWYQGAISFSDSFWKLDIKTSLFKTLASPRDIGGQDIDGTNLVLDSRESKLLVTNKRDGTLWILDLGR